MERADDVPPEPLSAAFARSGLTYEEVWLDYAKLGGNLSEGQLTDALRGRRALSTEDHDLLALALNEHFLDRGEDHPVPYTDAVENTGNVGEAG